MVQRAVGHTVSRAAGNREALLDGALACLIEKGFARTTARDVASRAGTSLAAIGYHFGGTEALLVAAIGEAFSRWRSEIAAVLAAQSGRSVSEAIDAVGRALDDLLRRERALMVVFLESLAVAEHRRDLREIAAALYDEDRAACAALLAGARGHSLDDDVLRGSILMAVVDGLIIQKVIGGDVPTAGDVLSVLLPGILRAPAG